MSKANQMLTVAQRNNQLLPWGRKIVSHAPTDLISVSTEVDIECLCCGTVVTGKLANYRNRTCSQCGPQRSFGERLLDCFIRFYVKDEKPFDFVAEYKVKGLDPTNPDRVLALDWASPERTLALEVHSEYHEKDHEFFNQKIDQQERERLDLLKTVTKFGGTHLKGPLEGWTVGILWWELKECQAKAQSNPNSTGYLPILIDEFKELSEKIGLKLRDDGVEISYENIYKSVETGNALSVIKSGFKYAGEWKGAVKEYDWTHESCGGTFHAPAAEIWNAICNGESGCKWCDRTGRQAQWLDFIDRLGRYSIGIRDDKRLANVTEKQLVTGLFCVIHPEEVLEEVSKMAWYSRLRKWDNEHEHWRLPDGRLKLCKACARPISSGYKESPSHKEWARKFSELSYSLIKTETPGTKRAGKQQPTTGVLRCSCNTDFEISNPAQMLAKKYKGTPKWCTNIRCENNKYFKTAEEYKSLGYSFNKVTTPGKKDEQGKQLPSTVHLTCDLCCTEIQLLGGDKKKYAALNKGRSSKWCTNTECEYCNN